MSNIKTKIAAISAGVGLGLFSLATMCGATADPLVAGVNAPPQVFVSYAKEQTLDVIGIVLLGVGAIFAVSLGIALAFRWFKRAAK